MPELSKKDSDYILSIQEPDINLGLLLELFAPMVPGKPGKYDNESWFRLPKGFMRNPTEGLITTVPVFIFNKYIIETNFTPSIGYYNRTIDNGNLKFLEELLVEALEDDVINTDQMADYYDRIQWLGGCKLAPLIAPSITPALLRPQPQVMKLKEKLLKDNKDAIANGDAIVASKIESELLSASKVAIKNDIGMDNFSSGAKISFNNNYKAMNLMKGPLKDNSNGGYKIATSNYNTGVTKDEFAAFSDSSVEGVYAKAIDTAFGGYQVKKYIAAFQDLEAEAHGTDCRTKEYLNIIINPNYKKLYINRYVIENGKLVLLTKQNIDSYVGKNVRLRSPMYCHMKPGYCNKCVGEGPYKLGMLKFGLAINRMGTTLLNAGMKKFHDSSIKLYKVDPTRLFVV
jgi:hypothetical protein